MTVEELKAEADKLGYRLIKKPMYIKILPCVCGCKIHKYWHNAKTNESGVGCPKCERIIWGKDETEAKMNWNEIMRCSTETKGENDGALH